MEMAIRPKDSQTALADAVAHSVNRRLADQNKVADATDAARRLRFGCSVRAQL